MKGQIRMELRLLCKLFGNKIYLHLMETGTCWDATTEDAYLVQWGKWIDLCKAAWMSNCVFAKCGCANKVVYRLSVHWKTGFSIVKRGSSFGVYSQKVTHIAFLRLAGAHFKLVQIGCRIIDHTQEILNLRSRREVYLIWILTSMARDGTTSPVNHSSPITSLLPRNCRFTPPHQITKCSLKRNPSEENPSVYRIPNSKINKANAKNIRTIHAAPPSIFPIQEYCAHNRRWIDLVRKHCRESQAHQYLTLTCFFARSYVRELSQTMCSVLGLYTYLYVHSIFQIIGPYDCSNYMFIRQYNKSQILGFVR